MLSSILSRVKRSSFHHRLVSKPGTGYQATPLSAHQSHQRIDNSYTSHDNPYIYRVYTNGRNQCAMPPSICGPCLNSAI